ncbi:MAG: MraY family glycosyltransferase [Patescibacteria group bacterium]|jgi:UDP-GlcNAc:undecaprenyl-phosphate GlcNAc-1-phosphate transferase
MIYVVGFFGALLLGLVVTPLVIRLARHLGLLDVPAVAPHRKIHKKPMPLLGGSAIMFAFFFMTVLFMLHGDIFSGELGALSRKAFWGIAFGAAFLLVGGFLDDKYDLRARWKFVYPIAATFSLIVGGIGVLFITNPFGGIFNLEQIRITLFSLDGIPYQLVLFADVFTFLWLMGSMFTTKFLDGMDGLVTGIGVIGAVVIFLLSLRPEVAQPELALLSAIFGGALLGFFPYNFYPARIFLGEGGSLFVGFILGTLSILAGGKIATALLILGLPILDVAWAIMRRLMAGRSPFSADRQHLHHRLLDSGLPHRTVVLFFYGLTLLFGFSTLFVRGAMKAAVLVILVFVMALLAYLAIRFENRKVNHKPHE